MRNTRIVIVCLVMAVATLAVAAASLASCLSAATEATLVAPFATGIDEMLLDGVIWLEWDDAGRYELVIGSYPTDVFVKHDDEYFYIAMVIHTDGPLDQGLEAFVFFDNGDGVNYSTGDDMLVVSAQDGALLEADYYYPATYNFRRDADVGGTNDALGAGKYDDSEQCYVFEFRRLINSEDPHDMRLIVGEPFSATYGWAG